MEYQLRGKDNKTYVNEMPLVFAFSLTRKYICVSRRLHPVDLTLRFCIQDMPLCLHSEFLVSSLLALDLLSPCDSLQGR